MLTLLTLTLGLHPSDLGSDSFRVREAEQTKIGAALPWSLPIVVQGLQDADPEIAYRSGRILQLWKQRNAVGYVLFNPKLRLLLTLQEPPTHEVYEEFKTWPNRSDLIEFAKAYGIMGKICEDDDALPHIMAARAKCIREGRDPQINDWYAPPWEKK